MFAPPSLAALAIFPNYDPKPNASARIAVLGKLPAAQTFGHVVHHGPGGWTSGGNNSGAGRTSTRSGPRRRLWARDGSESPTNQREPTVKIATLIDELARDGEAEASAAKSLRRRGVGLGELLKQLRLLLRRHADASIGNGKLDHVASIGHPNTRGVPLGHCGTGSYPHSGLDQQKAPPGETGLDGWRS
jgi:hypothetical protein